MTLDIATRAAETTVLPGAARDAALISLADGLACMMAATGDAAVAPFLDHASGAGRAVLLSRSGRVSPSDAALANGALAHAADFEDTFERGMIHPNASVIPAVLALADGADGCDVLAALALGCDLACRLSLIVGNEPAARGWYHPPMITAAGAALACARLLRLSPQGIVDAIGLTLCQFSLGGGLKTSPMSDLRAVREGLAARAAVEGALLAQRGVRAVDDPLFGPGGLVPMLLGRDAKGDFADFGIRFHGPEVAIKRWPSCRGTHGPIQLGLMLRGENVAGVEMTVAPLNRMLFLPQSQKHRPQSVIEAKFSSPFCFATALLDGEPTLASFADLARPDRLALAAKVVLVDGVPVRELDARVQLADGSIRAFSIDPPVWPVGGMVLADLLPKVVGCADASAYPFDAAAFLQAVSGVPDRGVVPVLDLLAP